MKTIPLTQGKVALVDDQDYERLNQWRWYAQRDGNMWYARRRKGRAIISMHQELLDAPVGLVRDHKDRNGLNNQRDNLRVTTRAHNSANSKLFSTNTSGYRGVYRRRGRWQALIQIDGRLQHLGVFQAMEDAARAYDEKALEVHGEFAALNFAQRTQRGQ